MNRHPVIGYELLKPLPDIGPEILDGVRHHHREYLDGSGYPDGLTAPEISDLRAVADDLRHLRRAH